MNLEMVADAVVMFELGEISSKDGLRNGVI